MHSDALPQIASSHRVSKGLGYTMISSTYADTASVGMPAALRLLHENVTTSYLHGSHSMPFHQRSQPVGEISDMLFRNCS